MILEFKLVEVQYSKQTLFVYFIYLLPPYEGDHARLLAAFCKKLWKNKIR